MAYNYRNIAALFASDRALPFIIIKAGPDQLYEEGTAAEAEAQGHRVTHTLTHSTIYPRAHADSPAFLELFIIEEARKADCLAEVCNLIDYDPDVGRVPEHWRVKPYILQIARAVAARARNIPTT